MNKYDEIIDSINLEIKKLYKELKEYHGTDYSIEQKEEDEKTQEKLFSLLRENSDLEKSISQDTASCLGTVIITSLVPLLNSIPLMFTNLPKEAVISISTLAGTCAVGAISYSIKNIKRLKKHKKSLRENKEILNQYNRINDPTYMRDMEILSICPCPVFDNGKPSKEEQIFSAIEELEIKRDKVIELRDRKLLSLSMNDFDRELNSEFDADEEAKTIAEPYLSINRRQ